MVPCADQTHCKDGIERDLEVVAVAVFGERVEHGQLGIRSADQSEGERNRFTDDGVVIMHLSSLASRFHAVNCSNSPDG